MEPGKLISGKIGTVTEPGTLDLPRTVMLDHAGTAPNPTYLVDYWRMLRKYRWTIVASTIIVATLVTIASLRMTPKYEASGRIAIYKETSESLGLSGSKVDSWEADWNSSIDLDTQVKVLQSDLLALQVIHQLQLDRDSAFAPPGANEEALLRRFHKYMKVTVIPRTRVVEIQFVSPSAKLAAQIVNATANAYIDQNFKTKFEATLRTSEWLTNQLADLQVKVETSQERLVRYQREKGILGLDEKQNIITSKLDQLNKDLTDAESERIRKEAAYRMAQGGDAEHAAMLDNTSLISKLRAQEADLQTQLADLSTQFGPSYPKVQQIQNQIKMVRANIKDEDARFTLQLKTEYMTALQRERMLRTALESQKQEANHLNESAIEYNLLKRDLDSNRQLYEGLLQRLKEAGVTAGLRSSNVRIIDNARVPELPAQPNIPRNIALGFLVGLIGGVVLAMVLETFDNTVRSPEQVESIIGLPSVGIIPLHGSRDMRYPPRKLLGTAKPEGGPTEIISFARPKSDMAESYRALRTSILLSALGTPPQVVLVTSSLPQEGKTTTSVNTAIVLAQKGGRVLLVDADMRRPSIGRIMNIEQSGGLSTVLAGGDKYEDLMRPLPFLPNLFVLPSGPPPPQPAELLGSEKMRELLAQWRQKFDHVIIDTPPVLSVTDPVLLSVQTDAVLIVMRASKTTKYALRRCRELLGRVNARVLGVVVNAVDVHAADSYYYYYYYGKHGRNYYETAGAGK